MDLSFSREEERFREEVISWLTENLPSEWRHGGIGGFRAQEEESIQRQWQRRLHDAGWLKLGWPMAAGGRAATPVMQALYQEELAKAGAPPILGRIGVTLLAPTLLVHGTDWQKEHYLEKILSGELIFCQGFSEPNAGSDLAGLRSKAERRGESWVLNGQKIWSSGAYYSDGAFYLARTAPMNPEKPHQNIGFFLLPLHQSGVEIRPIVQMTGGSEFCEIFLTDAEVDNRDLVPGDGWKIAMTTFGFERGGLANAARFERAVAALTTVARNQQVTADPLVRQRLAQAHIEAQIFRMTGLRTLTKAQQGAAPGSEASLNKLYWSEMDKRIQETAIAVQGMYGALAPDSEWAVEEGRWQYGWMWSMAETIYAGSSEIQRNIISERVLGLPRGR